MSDGRDRACDFSGHDIITAAFGFMIERNAFTGKKTVGFPIVARQFITCDLRDAVR